MRRLFRALGVSQPTRTYLTHNGHNLPRSCNAGEFTQFVPGELAKPISGPFSFSQSS